MTEIDRDALITAVRESGIALKPGDVLAVRLPMSASSHDVARAREYARTVEAETGVKVAFIPGEEFAHTSVNVTVNGFTGSEDELAKKVYGMLERYRRRNGGGVAGG